MNRLFPVNLESITYSFLVLMASGLVCISKAADPTPAPGPLIAFPQGNFSCTVEVTPHDAQPPDPSHPERASIPTLKKITITRIGNIRCDAFQLSDNTVSQLWTLCNEQMSIATRVPIRKEYLYVLPGRARNSISPAILNFDAASVAWIKKEARVDDSGDGIHYEATVTQPMPDGKFVNLDYHAWVDPKTLFPVKFDDGSAVYSLTFSTQPPTTPLEMPAELQAELNRWKEALAKHPHL